MNKSKGVKAVSLFVGILLSMALIQTAFAQSGNDAATGNEILAAATIDNSITPSRRNNSKPRKSTINLYKYICGKWHPVYL